ncbi:THAP domain-containing protein 1 [Halyomorpha halys]|uniref:THAP domain-containing protein 1 n=1 Tax=Halyomorpha halys TaxID=286706 RepID=UPI0006D4DBD5|nr:THAP domain-containing protein 4-like [Halyomorpha halys]XP_014275424.1 THAP domain-containing protein 4-like [Halyomorpha halys]XP_014275425.1 THAP domain-containing protein 4-like [Halyomorpha halys]XP_014275427.1 THAP domain-containing protein 4-like [Halyomorpha halys]XP_014275428.1 THAP domain-containing protein 4-like [Halyomorpha halys]XP_024219291.1 THAP domain-containing protein 4-like [Halyomorpha halys]XP_024219292.1 THAP domain-containing protein 4-like [Halyomorpha halys]
MVSCSAFGCTKRTGRDKVRFHRIPVDPKLRALWIKAINRKDWTPTTNCRICSDHFLPSDFNFTYHSGIGHLRDGVIPSVFPAFKTLGKRKNSKRRNSTELSDAAEPIPSTPVDSTPSLEIPTISAEDESPRNKMMRMEHHDSAISHHTQKPRINILLQEIHRPGKIVKLDNEDGYDGIQILVDAALI